MAAGVRERARHALRAEIAEAMINLFAERGFDDITVDEAAREVGISRATFFRYFGSKEDAVLAAIEAASIDYAAILAALPPLSDESPWQLLHRTFVRALVNMNDDSELERSRLRMINSTPSLRNRLVQRRAAHEAALTPVVAERFGDPDAARSVTVAALAVQDLAWRRWAAGEEPSVETALDHAFAHVTTGVAAKPTARQR